MTDTDRSVQRPRAVLQLNEPGRARQEQVLGNLAHILKDFVSEGIDLELVAHGDGLELLLRGVPRNEAEMEHLHRQGVRFLACGTTMRRLNIDKEGLRDFVAVVPSAMGHLIRRQAEGWAYVKA